MDWVPDRSRAVAFGWWLRGKHAQWRQAPAPPSPYKVCFTWHCNSYTPGSGCPPKPTALLSLSTPRPALQTVEMFLACPRSLLTPSHAHQPAQVTGTTGAPATVVPTVRKCPRSRFIMVYIMLIVDAAQVRSTGNSFCKSLCKTLF